MVVQNVFLYTFLLIQYSIIVIFVVLRENSKLFYSAFANRFVIYALQYAFLTAFLLDNTFDVNYSQSWQLK